MPLKTLGSNGPRAVGERVNESNFGKTSIGSYKGSINEKKIYFLTSLNNFFPSA
jgi:hypothetical protein